MHEVPVIVLDHLSETQRSVLVERGRGRRDAARRTPNRSQEVAFNLELVGFTDEGVEGLLRDPEESNVGLTDDNTIPEEEEHAITVLGDVMG